MKSLLTHALKYVDFGWCVIPLHTVSEFGDCSCSDLSCKVQGKHPQMERDSEEGEMRGDGSNDPDQVKEWWNRWPDSNIAICCGSSGLIALDIDPRNDGDVSLEELKEEHGDFTETLTSQTGGGGLHLLFQHPGIEVVRNRIGLLPGIDVKADKGRIVAPPSRHPSGTPYKWSAPFESTQISEIPSFLLDMIQTKKGTGTRRKVVEEW